jgi:hypothetical protein
MKKYVAIAPKEGRISGYLENGKEYPITEIHGLKSDTYGRFFHYLNGNHEAYSGEKGSSHLNGLDWEIKEVEA